MTKKEYVERNIGMTFDFIKHIIDHPETIDTIPNGAELDFIDKDVPFKAKEQEKRRKVARYKVEHVFEPIKANKLTGLSACQSVSRGSTRHVFMRSFTGETIRFVP